MKISKLILFGIAGLAAAAVVRKLMLAEAEAAHEDDLFFDADFIPGSKKLNLDLPDHVDPSWFRAPSRHAEDTDALFI